MAHEARPFAVEPRARVGKYGRNVVSASSAASLTSQTFLL
jgi:hypothetical protein